MAPDAPWCSLCLAPRGSAAPATGPAVTPIIRTATQSAPSAIPQKTRFGHSETTFGLKGRIVLTILLFLPLGLFLPAIAMGIGIIGSGIWIFVVIPWGLRDIWRHSHVRGLTSAVPPPAMSSSRFGGEDPPA
jgi:hypothetical protein